jgi:carboxymethylenebutenolidase
MEEAGFESVDLDFDHASDGDIGLLATFDDVLAEVASRGWSPDQVGVLGSGNGGRASLVVAATRVLGAAVSVDGADLAAVTRVTTPWLGLFGPSPPAALAAFRDRLRAESAVHTEVVGYSRALAGPGVDALAQWANFDSVQRCVEWFERRLAPRPSRLAAAWATTARSSRGVI